jgi:MFS transporter, FLVCR family, MFS-domain-containing protein 7
LGAALLLVGIVAAVITAPLFDRVFTHHLALTSKVLVPCIGCAWIGFIFAGKTFSLPLARVEIPFFQVRPHNAGALFVLMAILGACSLTMLPVALELACELTRNADGSSALLWLVYVSFSRTQKNFF